MQRLKGCLPFLLTGLLLGLSFPPMPLSFAAFFAFLPLLLGLETINKEDKFLLKSYFTFFIYHGMSNWWISSWQENTDPYLFISGFAVWLINPFFFLIPISIYRYVRKKFSFETALISFPFIWTLFEWGHGLGQLSYPWLNVAYSQIEFSQWIQQLDIWGIYGAGFAIAAFNASLTYFVKSVIINKSKKQPATIALVGACVLFVILPVIYGLQSLDTYKNIPKENTLEISIIQPNKDPWEKWKGSPHEQVIEHMKIQDSLFDIGNRTDLSLWSETAVPYISMDFNSRHHFSFLQRWLDKNKISLITGMARYELFSADSAPALAKKAAWDSSLAFQAFNSSVLITHNKNKPQVYNKAKLTPFAERIPYAEYLPFATDFLNWGVGISAWGLGKEMRTLDFEKDDYVYKIGTIICIESIYPEFCTGFVNAGANILTVITNDAWYNYTPGPFQHYVIARARAIENRRYIARCANSGISGLISPTGESIKEIAPYTKAGMNVSVPAIEEVSFYSKHGDYIGKMSLAAVIILLSFAYYKTKRGSK